MQNQIRIMELRGTYKGGGGPDKTILLSAARHDPKNFFILVVYLRDPLDDDFQIGVMAEKLEIKEYVEIYDRRILDLNCVFQLHRLIHQNAIQIIHVHDLKTTMLGVILKIFNPNVKIMHTAHGWIVNSKMDKVKQKFQFMLLKLYPFHIAVSEATKKILVENGIKSDSIKVLYNSIDIDHWKKSDTSPTIKNEFGISDDSLIIGTVGRLSNEKDLMTFLKVAKNIINKFPHVIFMIVGAGKNGVLAELAELAEKLGIQKSVIFTGHRSDLKRFYASFDIFLSTSLTEGIPNTILEAMSMKVPVVATNVGGIPEMIVDGESGILCEPGDVDGITKLTLHLLSGSQLKMDVAGNGRAKIENNFSFTKRLEIIEDYYRDLAKVI